MSHSVQIGHIVLDTIEQRILVALDGADQPKTLAQLRSETGESRQSIWYRLVDKDQSLVDKSIVAREEGDPPTYCLTIEGQFLAEDNRDELELPKSFTEMQDEIRQARKVSESAKESVQSYRQKVSRTKDTAETAEERVEEIGRKAATEEDLNRMMMTLQTELLESLNARMQKLMKDIGDVNDLEGDTLVDEIHAMRDILNYHKRYLDTTWENAKNSTQNNEERIENIREDVDKLEIDRVAGDLDADSEETGWLFGR